MNKSINNQTEEKAGEITKGEWKAHGNGVHVGIECVAVCRRIGGSEEVFANAALIAAAPDLFKACEKLLEYVTGEFESKDGTFGGASKDVEFARKAISKARGER